MDYYDEVQLIMNCFKTSDSDIWNYGHYFDEQFQITKINEYGDRLRSMNNIKGTFTLLNLIKKIGKIVLLEWEVIFECTILQKSTNLI